MRVPANLEVSSLIRLAETNGCSAMVLSKGERDAGTILIVTMYRGGDARLYERMPQLDGTRSFVQTKEQDPENPVEFNDYVSRRQNQDPDSWIIELDIANPQQFIDLLRN